MDKDSVLRIDNYLYDAQKLAAIHPGGEFFVLQACGTDATALYNTSHRRRFNHDAHVSHRVVETEKNRIPKITANQDWTNYFELCERVKPILADTNGFAPFHYYIKVFCILAATLYLDVIFFTKGRTVVLTLLAGLLRAFIGLNIQHDANHGAVSRHYIVNRLLGLTQDYIGGSSIGWSISHNVVHHTVCNDTVRDHDLDIAAIRLKQAIPWLPVHRFQHIYVWLLQALFGPVHMIYNFMFNWIAPESRRPLLQPFFHLNRALSCITVLRLVVLHYLHPTWEMAALTLLEYCFGGLYLAFFFMLSHNFEGVEKEGIDYGVGTCFVKNQTETSSDVGGDLLIFFNGGLNLQVVHHLFPRVSHCHYSKMAEVCRSFCREKGNIRYVHFKSLWENAASLFRHLRTLGNEKLRID